MRGLLEGLGLAGPAVVIGHDIGAMLALGWAAAHPADVTALVLLEAVLPGLGLEEIMNVAEGGMWPFGFFMTPDIPEMLFDGHELEFFTATFRALGTPGTFSDEDLATYAEAYRGRDGAVPDVPGRDVAGRHGRRGCGRSEDPPLTFLDPTSSVRVSPMVYGAQR
jgi:pimeloyl-ACP methyl ester carboxylesterase